MIILPRYLIQKDKVINLLKATIILGQPGNPCSLDGLCSEDPGCDQGHEWDELGASCTAERQIFPEEPGDLQDVIQEQT